MVGIYSYCFCSLALPVECFLLTSLQEGEVAFFIGYGIHPKKWDSGEKPSPHQPGWSGLQTQITRDFSRWGRPSFCLIGGLNSPPTQLPILTSFYSYLNCRASQLLPGRSCCHATPGRPWYLIILVMHCGSVCPHMQLHNNVKVHSTDSQYEQRKLDGKVVQKPTKVNQ